MELAPNSLKRWLTLSMLAAALYVAVFFAAWLRFESRLDRIETRAIMIAATASVARAALERVPEVQRMKRPYRPALLAPWSLLFSFLPSMETRHPQNVEEMRDLLVAFGDQLSALRLPGADLAGADLRKAHLTRTNLSQANLSGADLRAADLRAADLTQADLRGANLTGTYLRDANLSEADLRGSVGFSEWQMSRAKHGERAYRDPEHAYGRPLPPPPERSEAR